MTKNSLRSVLLFTLLIALLLYGCKQKPEIATKLTEHYKNDVYKDFDTAAYHAVFKKQLELQKPQLHYADVIEKYYTNNNYEPHFTQEFLTDGQLRKLVQYLNKAKEHGINPQ